MADDDIARLYDFQAGNTISSNEVDAEFNAIVTAMNGKMSINIIPALGVVEL